MLMRPLMLKLLFCWFLPQSRFMVSETQWINENQNITSPTQSTTKRRVSHASSPPSQTYHTTSQQDAALCAAFHPHGRGNTTKHNKAPHHARLLTRIPIPATTQSTAGCSVMRGPSPP
jgi:hypothetical protein